MIPHLRGAARSLSNNSNNGKHSSMSATMTMANDNNNGGSFCSHASAESPSSSSSPTSSSSSTTILARRRQQTSRMVAGMILFGVGLLILVLSDMQWNVLHSSSSSASSSSSRDTRHPLRPRKQPPPRGGGLRLSALTGSSSGSSSSATKNDKQPVRYLAFGGSSTWGNGLTDPNREAFPYVLSPAAHNAAVKSGGYSLAAACTQTIVQDDVYDVILIEFTIFDESIGALSRRLRERFPNATILFVRLWHPHQMKYRQTNNNGGDGTTSTTIDFLQFHEKMGKLPMHETGLYFEVLKSGADKWFIDIPDQEYEIKAAAAKIQARYLKLPVPDQDIFSFPITMRKTMELFDGDDLSKHGHKVIAESIRGYVREEQIVAKENRDHTGTWGSGDQCNLWYSHGDFELAGRRLRAVEFDHNEDDHRHALEISPEGSSFDIQNPFSESRVLYLTYMTSSVESDDQMLLPYPDMRVSLNDKPTVLIEPYHGNVENVEYARTSAVGMVPPGTSTVHLQPTGKSRRNFRLVGASFLPADVVRELPNLEFNLEPESRDVLSSLFQWY